MIVDEVTYIAQGVSPPFTTIISGTISFPSCQLPFTRLLPRRPLADLTAPTGSAFLSNFCPAMAMSLPLKLVPRLAPNWSLSMALTCPLFISLTPSHAVCVTGVYLPSFWAARPRCSQCFPHTIPRVFGGGRRMRALSVFLVLHV